VLPYVLGSTVIHAGYYWMLHLAYRTSDLSVAYPIARGLAPVLVALGAQAWIGERLPLLAWAGILCVSAGIMVLSVSVLRRGGLQIGIAAAVGTGVFIASYSLVDGVGVRQANTALGYIGWLFVAELTIVAYIFPTRLNRLRAMSGKTVMLGVLGGAISGLAYGLVLYAKTLAPLGMVSALRETSVIFAALFGVIWFGEGPRANRMFAAVIVAGGSVLIAVTG
jgi:drug/metabolite transporter (DMT)-like permease